MNSTTVMAATARIGDNNPWKQERRFEGVVMTSPDNGRLGASEAAQAAIDPEILERARNGDIAAMESIYGHFKRPVFGIAWRYTGNAAAAEDLLQDVFLKVFSNIRDVRNTETFAGWVYKIAVNTCFSYLRKMKTRFDKTVPLSDVEGRLDEAVYDSHETDLAKSIDEAAAALPSGLRSVFLLYDVQGFKHEEIAGILGCSVGNSKSQLFKARMRIREFLKDRQAI